MESKMAPLLKPRRVLRWGLLVALLVVGSAACGRSAPTRGTQTFSEPPSGTVPLSEEIGIQAEGSRPGGQVRVTLAAPTRTATDGFVYWQRESAGVWETFGYTHAQLESEALKPSFNEYPVAKGEGNDLVRFTTVHSPTWVWSVAPAVPGDYRILMAVAPDGGSNYLWVSSRISIS